MAKRSYKDYLNGKIQVTEANISQAVSWLSAAANKRLKRIEKQGWTYVKADAVDGETSIAGHRKFGAKGKTKQELFSEFKRLKDFFSESTSSVSGIREQAKKFKIREDELYTYVKLEENRKAREKYDRWKSEHNLDYVEYEEPLNKKEQKDFDQARKAEKTRGKRTGKTDNEYVEGDSKREWYRNWLTGLQIYNHLIETGRYKPMIGDSDRMREVCESVAADFGEFGYNVSEMADIAMKYYNDYINGWESDDGYTPSTSDFFNSNS